jgi:eukaryotic-like serine/threonine-protein kinase
MGAVWAAHHELIDRDVAIKISDAKLAARADLRERFLAEARAVGRLRHPNVVDVVDFGELPSGQLYIVFELLNGRSIEEFLEQSGRMTPFDAVTVAIEVCRGLEAAHALGVVHRDLKPANVFLHESPTGGGLVVKLLDFGISKSYDQEGVSLSMTQTGVVLGTPQYMSAEQARGLDDIDIRSDIWGVGVVLYETITGAQPFEGTNYNALLYAIMNDPPTAIASLGVGIPEALDAIIE